MRITGGSSGTAVAGEGVAAGAGAGAAPEKEEEDEEESAEGDTRGDATAGVERVVVEAIEPVSEDGVVVEEDDEEEDDEKEEAENGCWEKRDPSQSEDTKSCTLPLWKTPLLLLLLLPSW